MNPEWMAMWLQTFSPAGLRQAAMQTRASAVKQLELAVRMEIAADALEAQEGAGLDALARDLETVQ